MFKPISKSDSGSAQMSFCRDSKGFTLIELLVVVAIIGALAAIAIPAYSTYVDKAKVTVAVSTLDTVRKTLEDFHIDNQEYPTGPLDFTTGLDAALRTVFTSSFLEQINSDITFVSYVVVADDYTFIANAKDKAMTPITLTTQSISH